MAYDIGDAIENCPESVEGSEINIEPIPNRIDNWARSSIPVQIPDQEYLTERETEEKRKIRARQFIEDKLGKNDSYKQTIKRVTTAAATARMTTNNGALEIMRPQSAQKQEESKKSYIIEKNVKVIGEPKALDDDLRNRKAQELKEVYNIGKKKRVDKEKAEIEEKKRQKFQYEIKNKPYTYDVKGKIIFLPKDTQKLPDIPVPKTQWIKNEETFLSPHYVQFTLVKDSSAIVNEYEKKYKEFKTGDIPEAVTVTLADNTKIIKVKLIIY